MHTKRHDTISADGNADAALPGSLGVKGVGVHEILDENSHDFHAVMGGAASFGEFPELVKQRRLTKKLGKETTAGVFLEVFENRAVQSDPVGKNLLASGIVNVITQ